MPLAKRNQITRIQSFLEDLDTLRQMSKLSNGDIDINDEQEMWATILFLVHDLDIENPRHVIAVAHLVIYHFFLPGRAGAGRKVNDTDLLQAIAKIVEATGMKPIEVARSLKAKGLQVGTDKAILEQVRRAIQRTKPSAYKGVKRRTMNKIIPMLRQWLESNVKTRKSSARIRNLTFFPCTNSEAMRARSS